MGKASRAKRDGTRRERIAAQQAAARRAEVRNKVLMFTGVVVVIIALVVGFVTYALVSKPHSSTASGVSNGPVGTALASVVTDTTSVPASTLDTVGAGSGVTANSISAGIIQSPGSQNELQGIVRELGLGERWEDVERTLALDIFKQTTGRVGRGKDIAATVAFLASPLADFITGTNIVVDGGI